MPHCHPSLITRNAVHGELLAMGAAILHTFNSGNQPRLGSFVVDDSLRKVMAWVAQHPAINSSREIVRDSLALDVSGERKMTALAANARMDFISRYSFKRFSDAVASTSAV